MFDEKSINIHYKTPASRLLKMNTLNEFELNRIKKFYAQELANRRLQRSKSTRLSDAPAVGVAGKNRFPAHQQRHPQLEFGPATPMRPFQVAPPAPDDTPSSEAAVDLERYSHALTTKRRAGDRHRRRSGSRAASARFARALFDFCAKNEGELSVRRGELVELLELIDGNNWARVEDCQSGLQGLVPLSYLDHNIGCAVAKRDVSSASGAGCGPAGSRASSRMGGAESHLHAPLDGPRQARQLLAMSKGEPIALIRRLDGHLYEASNTRQATGLVWSNDLDIIRQPPAIVQVASNYEAPLGPNYCDFTDDDENDDGDEDGDYENDYGRDHGNDEGDADGGVDEQMVRCLRSIYQELDGRRSQRQLASVLSGERRRAVAADQLERRRRSRSASCALNEEQRMQQERERGYQAQQFCTMNKRQRQQVAAAAAMCQHVREGRHLAHRQPSQCNCQLGGECAAQQTAPVRSSSSPQIAQPAHGRPPPAGPAAATAELPRFCRARYAYKARQRDELDLAPGDLLVVVQECDDGWLIGHSYATKQMGTFPGNFVEPI